MEIQLDLRSHRPVYTQVMEQIRRLITTGQFPPGDQLPTVRSLARRLGVNFNTVARAYRCLSQDNLISTQPGRGSFILGLSTPRFNRSALQALAADLIAQARRNRYDNARILALVERELRRVPASRLPGDNLE